MRLKRIFFLYFFSSISLIYSINYMMMIKNIVEVCVLIIANVFFYIYIHKKEHIIK